MAETYYASKDKFKNFQLYKMNVSFNNGESIDFDKDEIEIKEILFADKLGLSAKDNRPCPLICKGEVVISPKNEGYYCNRNAYVVYDKKQYIKNRKDYVFNLVNNVGIHSIKVYNDNYYDFEQRIFTYVGNLSTAIKGDGVILTWSKPYPNCTCESLDMEFDFNTIKKSNVDYISLDIWNSPSFGIAGREIVDMQLNFRKKLLFNGEAFFLRVLDSGYLIIKPDKSLGARDESLICDLSDKIDVHHICSLAVSYSDYYDGLSREPINIPEIEGDADPLVKQYYDQFLELQENGFVGGYSKKLKDGTIIITFGENSKQKIEKLTQNKQ